MLYHKSRQDYQETMNLWKLQDHVMSILLEQPKLPQREGRGFLEKFYEGAILSVLSIFLTGKLIDSLV
jgi:NADH dehydrogenase (ubiquinone) 1 alpha subcomplex subunit 6